VHNAARRDMGPVADDEHVAGAAGGISQNNAGISRRSLDNDIQIGPDRAGCLPERALGECPGSDALLVTIEVQHHVRMGQVPMPSATMPGKSEGPSPHRDELSVTGLRKPDRVRERGYTTF